MKSPPIEWEDLINIGMSPDAQIFTDQEGFGVIPKQPILIVQLLGMMFASPPPSIEENKDDYLRHIRNALISLSDYTQLSDYPISQDKKQEWINYRQQLRDLPSYYSGEGPIPWPTIPD